MHQDIVDHQIMDLEIKIQDRPYLEIFTQRNQIPLTSRTVIKLLVNTEVVVTPRE